MRGLGAGLIRASLIAGVLWLTLGSAPGLASPGPLDPTVSCTSDPNIFNTGYDSASGGVLPNNATDANWQVSGPYDASTDGTSPATATSLPPSNATWTLANVGAVAGGAYSPSPYGNAQWISQQTIASSNQGTGSDNADWYYEYDFNLDPTVDPSTFSIAMSFLADNDVAQVWVNGVPQSGLTTGLPQSSSNPYDYQGYQLANAAATLLDADWQTGPNSIVVEIKSGPPDEGFDAQLRPSASCPIDMGITTSAPSASPYTPGQALSYTVTVTNGGPGSVADATVSDPLPAGLASGNFTWTCVATSGSFCSASGSNGIDDTVDVLAGGALTYTVTGTVPTTEAGTLSNTATLTPPASSTDTGCDPDCTAVSYDDEVGSALSLGSSVTSSGPYDAVGDEVDYRYTVTNTGAATMSSVGVDDAQTAPAGALASGPTCQGLAAPAGSCSGQTATLAPGQRATFTASYQLTQADIDNGSVTGSATASGDPPGCGSSLCATTSAPASATVDLTQSPSLAIASSSPSTALSAPGSTITLDFELTNTGNVTLSGITVRDTVVAPASPGNLSAASCPTASLAPGATEMCTATYIVSAADLAGGSLDASATASWRGPGAASLGTSAPSALSIPASAPALPASHAGPGASNAFAVAARAAAHGRIQLALTLPAAGTVTIEAWHWVPSNLRPRRSRSLTMFVVGARSQPVTAAGTPRVRLPLDRRGRAMLAFVGSFHFTLTFLVEVTFTPVAGTPRSTWLWVHVAKGRPWIALGGALSRAAAAL